MRDYSIASRRSDVTAGVAVTLFGSSTEDAQLAGFPIFVFLFLSIVQLQLSKPET
jgi:MFS-type transporter involved in bile tolerance (Atg22 family)